MLSLMTITREWFTNYPGRKTYRGCDPCVYQRSDEGVWDLCGEYDLALSGYNLW